MNKPKLYTNQIQLGDGKGSKSAFLFDASLKKIV